MGARQVQAPHVIDSESLDYWPHRLCILKTPFFPRFRDLTSPRHEFKTGFHNCLISDRMSQTSDLNKSVEKGKIEILEICMASSPTPTTRGWLRGYNTSACSAVLRARQESVKSAASGLAICTNDLDHCRPGVWPTSHWILGLSFFCLSLLGRSARSWLSSFFSKTAPSPMRIGRMYFHTSIFISRRDMQSFSTLKLEFPISKNSVSKDQKFVSRI